MSYDITRIIAGWDHDPDEFSVRVVEGDDGREKIQLRLDMGLLQMEVEGRPDGQRPEDHDSWLEYYESQAAQHPAEEGSSAEFVLDAEALNRLLREGVQYYHRYLSFWHLKRYADCARDTERNLRLFAFVRRYARGEREKLQFDQWRPYVLMMHTRAVATPLASERRYAEALAAIEEAIRGVWEFLGEYDQKHRADQCAELTELERWRDEVRALLVTQQDEAVLSPLDRLRRRLQAAVADERFEEAARLRDEIAQLAAAQQPAAGE